MQVDKKNQPELDQAVFTEKNRQRLQAECARVLYGNLPDRETQDQLEFRYTFPSRELGHYRPQFLWDSCFHAIVYRWFDTAMAWEELRSLLVHQVRGGADDGMIPHMQHFSVNRSLDLQALFDHPERSNITQPPLVAVAALAVFEKEPDREALAAIYEAATRYHAWFDRRRDLDKDDLVRVVHPWETGQDASQRWDKLMGFTATNPYALASLAEQRRRMIVLPEEQRNFSVKPVDFNAIRAADLAALAEIARQLGREDEAAHYTDQAGRVRQAIRQKMIKTDGPGVRICDLVATAEGEREAATDSAARFVLLFGGCLKPENPEDAAILEILRQEITGDQGGFQTPYHFSNTPASSPAFNPVEYWRGNVWLPLNWLIYTGLRCCGFRPEARALARNNFELVWRHGFREFFNPLTGGGGQRLGIDCPRHQSWSTLALDMFSQEMAQPNQRQH